MDKLIMQEAYDIAVVGAGPAGLAAALAGAEKDAKVLLVEREARCGGILKQCIHDGFGLVRFGEKLSGPEYAHRFSSQLASKNITVRTGCFVSSAKKDEQGFSLQLTSGDGLTLAHSSTLVLATGCRERTARQVAIHGSRPAGVYTAGSAQYYTNILGQLPGKRCVILGSGDIGLIMARRLTLEGAQVLGVYEAKPSPGGLPRNIAQCLEDFNIPLHLSHTVTRVVGQARVEAVEVARVDEQMRPIEGSEVLLPCDTLILSVGLIPENELTESLDVPLHAATKGPLCDHNYMTEVAGIFCCGNALHVNDLVDYVSESGEWAGRAAAAFNGGPRQLVPLRGDGHFHYIAPQMLDIQRLTQPPVLYFRTAAPRGKTRVAARCNGKLLFEKTYPKLNPPEMERLTLPLERLTLADGDEIVFTMEVAK